MLAEEARPLPHRQHRPQLRQRRQERLKGELLAGHEWLLTGEAWEGEERDCAEELAAAERAFKGCPHRGQRQQDWGNHRTTEEPF